MRTTPQILNATKNLFAVMSVDVLGTMPPIITARCSTMQTPPPPSSSSLLPPPPPPPPPGLPGTTRQRVGFPFKIFD